MSAEYTPDPYEQRYADETRHEALRAVCRWYEPTSDWAHAWVSHQTVANWLKAYADRLPNQAPEPPDMTVDVNELDELFTFIGDKKTKSTS